MSGRPGKVEEAAQKYLTRTTMSITDTISGMLLLTTLAKTEKEKEILMNAVNYLRFIREVTEER